MANAGMAPSTARTLATLAAVLYPGWGLMMKALNPAAIDPLWERLAIAAVIASTWYPLGRPRSAGPTLHALFALIAGHVAVLVIRNDFIAPYAIGQLVVLGSIGAAATSRVFITGLTAIFVTQPFVAGSSPTAWTLSVGAATIGLVQWVVLRSRLALEQELAASMAAERAREEKLRHVERLATLGTVAATVAHELNNPLAWLSGNLSFLKKELPAGSEAAQAVQESLDGVGQLTTIVKDLKLLARRDDKVRAPFDCCAVARGAATLVRSQVLQRARFELQLDGEKRQVLGDGNRLAQVIINLLVNAAQAVPAGSPCQNVITLRVDGDERAVRIQVRDTGPGIPPEVQPHVFEHFFTTKPAGEGTGLGLAVCKEVVISLGGTLRFDTSPSGTCFEVELPACEEAELTPTPAPRLGPGVRGLVIDDERHICQTIRRAMACPAQVVLCNSVDEAMAALRANSAWDFVLCDVMLPGKTAVDLAAFLEREFPQLRARLVLMTGGVFTERERAFIDRTDAPVLEKPFSTTQLLETLERTCRRPALRGLTG